jgi:putative endopeptidase
MRATFVQLADRSLANTRQIVEATSGPPDTEAGKIAAYYRAFMDEAGIEARGLAPIQPALDQIAKISDARGVVRQLAASTRHAIATPIEVDIQQDPRAPDHYIAIVSQGGLGLPDRDMYDVKAAQFAALRTGYRAYIAAMFTLAGLPHAEPRAAAVYGLESPPRMLHDQPVAVWRDYLTLRALSAAAPHLGARFVATRFELDAWYDAFQPRPGDALYLAPDQRVKIW